MTDVIMLKRLFSKIKRMQDEQSKEVSAFKESGKKLKDSTK